MRDFLSFPPFVYWVPDAILDILVGLSFIKSVNEFMFRYKEYYCLVDVHISSFGVFERKK